ncbi:MAG TPA: preprotein translocase subunit SecE [Firmicutes bacterium]|jgi:preprotein translocase subunit SecE|nr:preprotein translocase subunit SecE [Bacillota bacterium]
MAAKKGKKKITNYFRSVIAELKKVAWPNRKEVTTYTAVVLVTVLAVALFISVFDSVLSLLFSRALKLY